MSFAFPETRTKTLTVTAVGVNQTFPIVAVKKGDIVLFTGLRRLVPSDAATDSTWQFALTTAGLVLGATIDTEGTALTLAASSVTMYLCLVDDTVELRYVQAATDGAVAPVARANVRLWRNRGDL